LDEARAALQRGRHVVLVTPPAVQLAHHLWELIPPRPPDRLPGDGPAALIVCIDDVSAAEWRSVAPAQLPVHAVTGLTRTARLLEERSVHVLAGAAKDLAALLSRSALKLETVATVVVAWPEALAAGAHAAPLDTLLAEAREARRIVLSWNPAALGDFLERHARRALVVGTPPVSDAGTPLGPIGRARYAIVPPSRRPAAVREALDALDPKRPLVWDGGPVEPAERPDAILCTGLPTREQFAALARLGEPVLFITAAQLPYVRSIAAPLTPLLLPSVADRARDRAEALREQVAQLLTEGNVDAELALLDPLFERFDPGEVAAALLALQRDTGGGKEARPTAPLPGPAWVKVFVNVGKKDHAAAKDLVGALVREVGVEKDAIGRIDLRETFSVVEVTPAVAALVARGLTGVTIKGRRALARLDVKDSRKA